MKKYNNGFSLIELMVVGAGGAIMLTVVFYILAGIFKQANRSRLTKIIDEQSAWLIFELKKNMAVARVDSLICPIGVGSSVGFENRYDGQETVISCIETDNKVASESANGVDLTSMDVKVVDCHNFVECQSAAGDSVSVVNFNFGLEAGNSTTGRPEDFVRKSFRTSVVVRQ